MRILAFFISVGVLQFGCLSADELAGKAFSSFDLDIKPLLVKYCADCHSGDEPSGEIDFTGFESDESVSESFEVWEKVAQLVQDRKMPPEDELQPSQAERRVVTDWYQRTFVDSVEARPGTFRPRRLSATEYRNTLRSLFGFDLEVSIMEAEQTVTERSLVLKLLPTDPPGKSGFRNDTYSNPLSTQIWEQYSYLADYALDELFSNSRRKNLEAVVGRIGEEFDEADGRSLLQTLLPRIYRRNVQGGKLEASIRRIEEAQDVIGATRQEIKAAMMSPEFLYRGLLMEAEPGAEQSVDDYELAERLSYFLWADMPDGKLFEMARSGGLRNDEILHEQVERMLDSAKSETLATDFATQWLALNEIEHVSNNPPMMLAYKSQPIDFFKYLISDDRPLLELIDSRTAFANPLTKKFYGSDGNKVEKYRKPKGIEIEKILNSKITLEDATYRGGILTMPGVLAMNRGPILRGVWMVERIMGEHLPDPPADVGQVKANVPGENLTFRQRFEQHRENPSCALCHDKIDPLGFALEGYDASGNFRPSGQKTKKRRKEREKEWESNPSAVDTSGALPSGETFASFNELKKILMTTQREPVVRNITERMLSYALCRKLEIYDRPTVDKISGKMLESNGTWRDLVHEIVDSLPFRKTFVPKTEESKS